MERKPLERDDVVFVTVMIGVAIGLGVLLTNGSTSWMFRGTPSLMDTTDLPNDSYG